MIKPPSRHASEDFTYVPVKAANPVLDFTEAGRAEWLALMGEPFVAPWPRQTMPDIRF